MFINSALLSDMKTRIVAIIAFMVQRRSKKADFGFWINWLSKSGWSIITN